MIGIIVAEEEELEAIKPFIMDICTENRRNQDFFIGSIGNNKVVVAKCDMGKVNSARLAQMLLDFYDVTYIINIGVAGGIFEELNIGDIVVATRLAQYDVDLTAFGRKMGELPNIGDRFFYGDKTLISYCNSTVADNGQIYYGTIVSGDRFVTSKEESKRLKEEFDAYAVEMEGGAIAQICHLSNIPFLVLRCISDCPNNENVVDFKAFLVESSKNIAKFLNSLLKNYSL